MYLVSMTAKISWAPDGAGPETVPNAQTIEFSLGSQGANSGSFVLVPGGNAPTTGNINTAIVAAGAAISTAAQAAIAQIQGFATGLATTSLGAAMLDIDPRGGALTRDGTSRGL